MRLWSLHPRHLDARRLLALWREGLLARAVLAGATTGYRHHPQLDRFRERRDPLAAIDCYLSRVVDEARARSYRFDVSKIRYRSCRHASLVVTSGQLEHEWALLLAKLKLRDRSRSTSERQRRLDPHPCFRVVDGPVAAWERTSTLRASKDVLARCSGRSLRSDRRLVRSIWCARCIEPGAPDARLALPRCPGCLPEVHESPVSCQDEE